MIDIKNKVECCGCHACFNACPTGAIEMKEDEKGFKYPIINKSKCVDCGLCERVCPIIISKKIENKPNAYACFNKNDDIRKRSSSGGVFTLLATNIIKKGGIVFGATFDEEFNIKHIKIQNTDELDKLRGSKYVQSTIGDTYKQAKNALDKGIKVLFTGTPCQVEGLKAYLQKDYDNLYTQDIVCHGVPSPLVWKKYKEYRKQKDIQSLKPNNIYFRDKEKGWKNFGMKFSYEDFVYFKTLDKDLFMQTFLQNLSLRDSCFECSFKKKNRIADITLADFWGINNIAPEMNDDKGTSLVIINSEKGKKLFDEISNSIGFKKVDLEQAIKYNNAMIESVHKNPNREKFFEDLEKENFAVVAKRYIKKTSIIIRVLRKIKRIIIK